MRIEDTDQQRSTREHEAAILASLSWLGLDPDRAPIRQSERYDLYRAQVERLLAAGSAYRCFASRAELDELRAAQIQRGEKPRYDRRWRDRQPQSIDRPHTVRFATPQTGTVSIDDVIRGQLTVANAELDDPVILREDQSPTYNFACAVDDADLGISHVIRGEDHITNSLCQAHIHAALGKKMPLCAHLPLILAPKTNPAGELVLSDQGKPIFERMSKRAAAASIDSYRDQGFLAVAVVNYLAQMGWTHPAPGREVFQPATLVAEFDLSRVHKSAARFDIERLRWLNQQHLRVLPAAEISALTNLAVPAGAIAMALEKARTLTELKDELAFFSHLDSGLSMTAYVAEDNREALPQLLAKLAALTTFGPQEVKMAITEQSRASKLGFARLGMPLRVALTGRKRTPDVSRIAAFLGQAETLARLSRALERK